MFGGVMLLRLLTPMAALLLLLDMGAAMWKYNFNEGIYAVREYELPLVLGLAALGLATTGGRPIFARPLKLPKEQAEVLSPIQIGQGLISGDRRARLP